MSLIKIDSQDRDWWTLFVPDEHCFPGLEVGVQATREGLRIGGELISWEDLESARHRSGGSITQ